MAVARSVCVIDLCTWNVFGMGVGEGWALGLIDSIQTSLMMVNVCKWLHMCKFCNLLLVTDFVACIDKLGKVSPKTIKKLKLL